MDSDSDEEYNDFEFPDYDENFESNQINLELVPSRELFKWDSVQTFCLIEVVKRHYAKFEYQIERKIWAEVSKEVDKSCGFKTTGDQCEFKFKSLKIIYEKVKLNNKLTTWIFFEALDDILSKNREMLSDVIDVYTDVFAQETRKSKLISPRNKQKENFNESKSHILDKEQSQCNSFEVNQPLSSLSPILSSPEKNKLSNIDIDVQYSDEMEKPTESCFSEKFKWSAPQIVCLINAIKMNFHQFDCKVKSKAWIEVAKKVENLCGLKVTGHQCDSTFNHLIKLYKKFKLNNNPRRWQFFDYLEDLVTRMPTANYFSSNINDKQKTSSFIQSPSEYQSETSNRRKLSNATATADNFAESFRWTTSQTFCLIDAVRKHYDQFDCRVKIKVFAKVSKEMENLCGFRVTAHQCMSKFDVLERTYEKMKLNDNGRAWRFFDALNDLLSKKPTTNLSEEIIQQSKSSSFILLSADTESEILNKNKLADIEQQHLDRSETPDDFSEQFKWTTQQTLSLINAIKIHYEEFHCGFKRKVFAKVAKEMENLCGLQVNGEQCNSKFRSLKKIYKKVKSNNDPCTWKYFEDMEDILSYSPNRFFARIINLPDEISKQSTSSSFIVALSENQPETLKANIDIQQQHLQRAYTPDDFISFRWNTPQTFCLIDAIKKYNHKFDSQSQLYMWDQVAKEVENLCGLKVTGQQCENKLKHLKQMYTRGKVNHNHKKLKFFEAFDDILKYKHTAHQVSTTNFSEEIEQQSTASCSILSSAKNESEILNRNNLPEMEQQQLKRVLSHDDLTEKLKWTTSQTSCLINAIKMYYDEFHCGIKRKVFAKVAKEMENLCGLQVTAEQCDNKLKKLKKIYEKVKSDNDCTTWEFFDDMEDILSYNPNRISTCIIDLPEEMIQQTTISRYMLSSAENESEDIEQRQLERATTPDDLTEKFTWSTSQTNFLVQAIKIHYDEFQYGVKKKAFAKAAKEIENLCGLQVTGEQCNNRFKNLKKMYDKGKLDNNPKTWKFLEDLKYILSHMPPDSRVSTTIDLSEENNHQSKSSGFILSSEENEPDILNRNKLSDIEQRRLKRASTPDDFVETFKWTTSQTSCLINAIKMHYDEFHCGIKKEVFAKVAKEVENLCGLQVTGEQCNNKFKKLKKIYAKVKLNDGRGTWVFFDDVEDILSYNSNRISTCIIDLPEEIIQQTTTSSPMVSSAENEPEILNRNKLSDIEQQQLERTNTPDDSEKFKWTTSQTSCLINAIKMHYDEFHCGVKRKVFAKVAREVENLCGLQVNGEQCNNRLRSLKKVYEKVKSNNDPSTWEFFDDVEDILSYNPNRISTYIIELPDEMIQQSTTSNFTMPSAENESEDIDQQELERAATPDDPTEKFNWSTSQTSCLVQAIKIHYDEFQYGVKRKAFAKIAKEVENLCGLQVTGDQCINKFKNLKKMYDKGKLDNNPKTWKFCEDLKDILTCESIECHVSTNTIDLSEEKLQQSKSLGFILSSEENEPETLNRSKLSDIELRQLKRASTPDDFVEKFNWSSSQTSCLINAIKIHYDEYQFGVRKKVFLKIAKEVKHLCGLKVTGDQCYNKFKSLKKLYDKGKLNNNPKRRKFFEDVKYILKYTPPDNHDSAKATVLSDELFPQSASNISSEENELEILNRNKLSNIEQRRLKRASTPDDFVETFTWNTSQTSFLINAIKMHYNEFQYGVKKKAFSKIAKEVENLCGLQVTGEQCLARFNLLKKKYSQGILSKTWKFFEDLRDILSDMPTDNHVSTSTTDLSEEMIQQSSDFILSSTRNESELLNRNNLSDIEQRQLKRATTPDDTVEKFNWSTSQTSCLINAIKIHYDEFNCGFKKKAWAKVAKEVKYLSGLKVTGQQCDDKVKDLLKIYKKVKLQNNSETWRFFEAVEDIILHMPTTNHVSTSTSDLSGEVIEESTSSSFIAGSPNKLSDVERQLLKRGAIPDDFISKICKY